MKSLDISRWELKFLFYCLIILFNQLSLYMQWPSILSLSFYSPRLFSWGIEVLLKKPEMIVMNKNEKVDDLIEECTISYHCKKKWKKCVNTLVMSWKVCYLDYFRKFHLFKMANKWKFYVFSIEVKKQIFNKIEKKKMEIANEFGISSSRLSTI